MTLEQLATALRAEVPRVEAAEPGTSPAPLVDRLWTLRRQAAQIPAIPGKVPKLIARAADTLEMLKDGPEAAKLLRTALAGLEPKRSTPHTPAA